MTERIIADAAVIGAGPGGYAAALAAAGAGLKTVLIEKREAGGTCLNRGCVPSKAWLAAEHYLRTGTWAEKTFASPHPSLDFLKLKEHQQKVTDTVRRGLLAVFRKKGVELLQGTATFISPTELSIDGGEKSVEFSQAVIATGSRPLNIFEGEGVYNTDTVFDMERLPSSIAVIGGGAVGMEMATFFSGMGASVTVIEALDDILQNVDGDIRSILKREMKKKGVDIKTAVTAENLRRVNGACELSLSDGSVLKVDAVLCAVGRKPNTEHLGLENAGVRTLVKGFVDVDGTMGTSREGIYAVGDVAGKAMLAYTAHHEGIVAARNMGGRAAHMDYRFIPYVIFSGPETGCVGVTEETLKKTGKHYRVGKYHVRALARAQAGGEISGMVKVLVGEDYSLLGVHIASPQATEMIHSAVTAMASGMKADALANLIYGHPTLSEAIPLAAADALGESIY